MKWILLMTPGHTNGSRLDNPQLPKTQETLRGILRTYPIRAAIARSLPHACSETAHEAAAIAHLRDRNVLVIDLFGPECSANERGYALIIAGSLRASYGERQVAFSTLRRIFWNQVGVACVEGATTLVVCPTTTIRGLLQAFGIKTDAPMNEPLSCLLLQLESNIMSLERVVPTLTI